MMSQAFFTADFLPRQSTVGEEQVLLTTLMMPLLYPRVAVSQDSQVEFSDH